MEDSSRDGRSLVRDDRRLPFCLQTHAALDAIRAVFPPSRLSTALAVYLCLTETANRRGGYEARNGFEATRAEIAERAGLSLDTFDRYAAELVDTGVLLVERRTRGKVNLPNLWVLIEPETEGGTDAPPSRTDAATPPHGCGPSRGGDQGPLRKKGGEGPPVAPPLDLRDLDRPAKVDRKPLTDPEWSLEVVIVDSFNRLAGTRFTPKAWVVPIVMRIREHPEIDAEGHAAIIQRALREPWWKGPPSPSIVYGNASHFERCIAALEVAPRSVTSSEVADIVRADQRRRGVIQ